MLKYILLQTLLTFFVNKVLTYCLCIVYVFIFVNNMPKTQKTETIKCLNFNFLS